MENTINLNKKKVDRKQRKCQHILEKETGIISSRISTKNIAICNTGLSNGLTEENILKHFLPYGEIEKIILIPGKSCGFITYKHISSAEKSFETIHGKLNIAQDKKPVYLSYTDTVPENENINKYFFPPGLVLIENFVSEEEEKFLLNCIHLDQTSLMKHRRVKHYGFEFNYNTNNVDINSPLPNKIPEKCNIIFDHLSETEFSFFRADQLTINEYLPGQGIPPHIDTHSAFEDPILSVSLCSAVNMDFRNNTGEHVSVLLPRRSLLIMSGESRYAWSHGITPRKMDIVSTENGVTVQERGKRISFTLRKVLNGECRCRYIENCDSYAKNKSNIECELAEQLESTHVHKVYEDIATHFSDTRHKPWPNVLDFVQSFPSGSILFDIGCGNGKYLGHNKNIFEIGCDRSFNLIDICYSRGFQAFTCNCLNIPTRNDVADGIISIAVIHHLANEDRRLQAIKEMLRILRTGGKALIYVWAKDQEKYKKSSYLKQDRKNRKENQETLPTHIQSVQSVEIGENISLPVHTNRTQFQHHDVLVPWKLKHIPSNINEELSSENKNVFLRYYHVFEEGELETMCRKIKNTEIVKSYYDQGNWCVVIKKL